MAASERLDRIAVLLKSSGSARNGDKSSFHAYASRRISLARCIQEFRVNNRIGEDVPIDPDDFREFIGDLGYRRYGYDDDQA